MELNRTICVTEGSNTGFGDCVLNPSYMAGAFLAPTNFVITKENIAGLQAFLMAAASAALQQNRIFPVHYFEQIETNSEDKTIVTLGYGGKAVVKEGDYDWAFQFFQGGLCLHKALRVFNGPGKSVYFYDANGVLYGTKDGDNLKPIPLSYFWADPWKPNDGTNATIYMAQFVFKPKYINENIGFIKTDFNLEDIKGLQTVAIKEAAQSAFPVLKIKAITGCAGEDLFDTYAAELAVVDAWRATSGGAEIAITSVSQDAALKAWTITVDTADANYNPDAVFQINLVNPPALTALAVVGFEGKALTIATA